MCCTRCRSRLAADQWLASYPGVRCPVKQNPSTTRDQEVIDVRRYLENSSDCRRKVLLKHFDVSFANPGSEDHQCCDVYHQRPAKNEMVSYAWHSLQGWVAPCLFAEGGS